MTCRFDPRMQLCSLFSISENLPYVRARTHTREVFEMCKQIAQVHFQRIALFASLLFK